MNVIEQRRRGAAGTDAGQLVFHMVERRVHALAHFRKQSLQIVDVHMSLSTVVVR